MFSRRLDQLNIPLNTTAENLSSEIVELIHENTNTVQYTIWLRKDVKTGRVAYCGIYGTCRLSSGPTCVKAVFPLPKGNATVIMTPIVGENSELILDSSGKRFGDADFYFLLNDDQNNFWSQYIASFTDKLVIREEGENLTASQILKLWGCRVAEFNYYITTKAM